MLVTFNQALELDQLGFKDETRHVYTSYLTRGEKKYILEDGYELYKEVSKDWNSDITSQISAPSVSSALQWIRENKGIVCGVLPSYYQCRRNVSVFYIFHWFHVIPNVKIELNKSVYNYPDYPSAESALLTAILEYLKEKK